MAKHHEGHHKKHRAARVRDTSFKYAWTFPALISVTIVVVSWYVLGALQLPTAPVGPALSARVTWGVAAMFFAVFFVFAVVACHTLMFRCGDDDVAVIASGLTTAVGVVAIAFFWFRSDLYLGPAVMKAELEATAFCLPGVRVLTSIFDALAIWAAVLVVTTSCVIAKHDVDDPGDLSRQLRAAKLLMYVAAALLIAGVAETGALHKWPAHEKITGACGGAVRLEDKDGAIVEAMAVAISTGVGAVFSLVLAAAYLPLGIILRQRAYRVVTPWERTEAWLAMHGLALQPAQQLAKVLLVLSPLIAGGPVSYLITLLSGLG